MRNLLDFLSRHNHWLLFIILEVVSMVLLFHYNSYQGSVWFSSANAMAGSVYRASSAVTQYFSLTDVNRQLTERNLQLERQLNELAEVTLERTGDSALVARTLQQTAPGVQMIPAKVVSNSLDKLNNFITIDKGEADGVQKDMGVVCGTGVVGIVYLTSAHYSVIIPLLSSESNVSCTILRRGYFGYMHWTGGTPQEAYMDDIPRHARFNLGDAVVTSGYSSVFPRGIMIGKILHVYNSENGMSYRAKVKLSTDFGRLRDVCVIKDKGAEEQRMVLQAAQDSIKPRE